jgi:hypothetical protein
MSREFADAVADFVQKHCGGTRCSEIARHCVGAGGAK